ncbi:hypothetical protein B7C42_06061 [Nocardia cerradoensis]|uniref:Uncharacterized protein n=1 Tax=Nocardia cerradoensis TaxID=85688 RepID=A0A231GYP5_9NOCA|nr:hypothetical protein B7C42_06061 [Nocardia cerradoensis]
MGEFVDDVVAIGPSAGRVSPGPVVFRIGVERPGSVGHSGQVQPHPHGPFAARRAEGLGVVARGIHEFDAQFANIGHVLDQVGGIPESREQLVQRLQNLLDRIDWDIGMIETGDHEIRMVETECFDQPGLGLRIGAQSGDVRRLLRRVRRMPLGSDQFGQHLLVRVGQHLPLRLGEVRQSIRDVRNLFSHRGDDRPRNRVVLPHRTTIDISNELGGERARHGLLGVECGPPACHLTVRADIPVLCAAPSPGDRVQQAEQLTGSRIQISTIHGAERRESFARRIIADQSQIVCP